MKTAAAVLLAFVLVLPAHSVEVDSSRCAAVAFSLETGSYGYGYNYGSRARAEQAALENCNGDDAKVVGWVRCGWIHLLIAEDGAYGVGVVYGSNASSGDAYDTALKNLRKHTKSRIKTSVRVCSGDVPPRVRKAD